MLEEGKNASMTFPSQLTSHHDLSLDFWGRQEDPNTLGEFLPQLQFLLGFPCRKGYVEHNRAEDQRT